MAVVVEQEHVEQHAPPRPPARGIRRFTRPGWLRALWVTPLTFGLVTGIVCLIRWGGRDGVASDPIWDLPSLLSFWTIFVPIGFLAGLGAFDYWAYWISGRPTRPEDHSSHGADSWKDYFRINTDHKVIGVQYLVTTFSFFAIAGLLALFMRAELAQPGSQFVDTQTFNGLFSSHAGIMIFLFIVPVFAGFGNYVIPLMIGAPDMAFPRLNALSFWLLPIAGLIMLFGFVLPGGEYAAGWTNYPPLADQNPVGNLMFQMGVQWAGASSILTALNFLVTIITMRAPGMTFWRLPLLVWANFTTSLLVVLATPFIAGSQFQLMLDRMMHANFFDPTGGGWVVGYQHIFWFYSHPAVYIMMLPGFGIVSEVIAVFARKPVFGYRLMAMSLVAILVLGFSVWAHHMFVAGMAPVATDPDDGHDAPDRGPDRHQGLQLARHALGGAYPLQDAHAMGPRLHIHVRDRGPLRHLPRLRADRHPRERHVLRRRAHPLRALRRVGVHDLRGGLLLVPEDDRADVQRDRSGELHFFLTFVAFNLTFFPQHYIGLRGMPRRVADYDPQFARLEHGQLDRRVHARLRGPDLLLQHGRQLAVRRAGAGESRGAR